MANPLDDLLGDFRDERARKALELARRLGILPEDGNDEAETTPLTPEVLDVLRRVNDLLEAPDELRALQIDATILQTSPPSGDASLDATLLETPSPSGASSTDATVFEDPDIETTFTQSSGQASTPPGEPSRFGRFTDVKFLAEGGMGQILEATDPAIDRRVAIKILQPDIESHQFHLVKFRNEFRLTGQLEHPGIVPVHETGQTEDGRVYFCMKLVQGESLAELLETYRDLAVQQNKPFDPTPFLRHLLRVCDALSFAHARGIVHRDLKPANLMVGAFGEVLVMDWGLARKVRDTNDNPFEESSGSLTQADHDPYQTIEGQVMGTPAYMAPEQARGEIGEIDRRTDVYALGTILYDILTGTPPQNEGGSREIIERVKQGHFEPPRQRAPKKAIPPELEAVVMKAMAPEKSDRYPDAKTFQDDIQAYLDGHVLGAARYNPLQIMTKWVVRNRKMCMGAAAVFLLSVGFFGLLQWKAWRVRQAHGERIERILAEASSQDLDPRVLEQRALEIASFKEAQTTQILVTRLRKLSRTLRQATRQALRSANDLSEAERIGWKPIEGLEEAIDDWLASHEPIDRDGRWPSPPKEQTTKQIEQARERLMVRERKNQVRIKADVDFINSGWRQILARRQTTALEQEGPGGSTLPTLICLALAHLGESEEVTEALAYYLWSEWDLKRSVEVVLVLVDQSGDKNRSELILRDLVDLLPEQSRPGRWGEQSEWWRRVNKRLKRRFKSSEKAVMTLDREEITEARSYYVRGLARRQKYDLKGAIQDLTLAIQLGPDHPERAKFYMERGIAWRLMRETAKAMVDLDRAIELDTAEKGEAYIARGNVRYDKGNVEGAIDDYQRGIKLNPERSRFHWMIGRARFKAGDLEGAIQDVNRAIHLDPDQALFYSELGEIHTTRGDLARAAQAFGRAIQVDPQNPKQYTDRGLVRVKQGDLEGANQDFDRAIKLNPELHRPYNLRGFIRMERGDLEGAIQDFDRALKNDPEYAKAYSNRGTARYKSGDIQGAISDYEKAIQIAPEEARVHLNLGRALAQNGDQDGAFESYDRAIQLNPKLPEAFTNRGVLLFQVGNPKGAIEDFNRAITLNPRLTPAYFNRCMVLKKIGNLDGALSDLDRILEITPHSSKVHFERGVLQQARGNLPGAIECFDRTIQIDPRSWEAHFFRARIRHKTGNEKSAFRDLDRCIQLNPQFTKAYIFGAHWLGQKGDLEGALTYCNRSLQANPQNAGSHIRQGEYFFKLKRYAEAEASFTKGIEIDPKLSTAYNNRGNALKKLGSIERALADYNQAIKLDQKLVVPYINRGHCHLELRNFDAAITDFQKALQTDPKQATRFRPHLAFAYYSRGNSFGSQGKLDASIADYDKALQFNPNLADAYYYRGNCYGRKGDFSTAIKNYDKALQLKPNLADAYYYRGNSFQKRGAFDAAIADYQKALQIKPKLASQIKPVLAWTYYSLGNSFQKKGDFDAATANYGKAIEINHRCAEAYFNRGNIRNSQDNLGLAIADYEKALEVALPNWRYRKKVEGLLARARKKRAEK